MNRATKARKQPQGKEKNSFQPLGALSLRSVERRIWDDDNDNDDDDNNYDDFTTPTTTTTTGRFIFPIVLKSKSSVIGRGPLATRKKRETNLARCRKKKKRKKIIGAKSMR